MQTELRSGFIVGKTIRCVIIQTVRSGSILTADGGSIKRLGVVTKGVVDNTLMHARLRGQMLKIQGEVKEMESLLFYSLLATRCGNNAQIFNCITLPV